MKESNFVIQGKIFGVSEASQKHFYRKLGLLRNLKESSSDLSILNRGKQLLVINNNLIGFVLRTKIESSINLLLGNGCYRGLRRRFYRPSRGQRTQTNARTVKRLKKKFVIKRWVQKRRRMIDRSRRALYRIQATKRFRKLCYRLKQKEIKIKKKRICNRIDKGVKEDFLRVLFLLCEHHVRVVVKRGNLFMSLNWCFFSSWTSRQCNDFFYKMLSCDGDDFYPFLETLFSGEGIVKLSASFSKVIKRKGRNERFFVLLIDVLLICLSNKLNYHSFQLKRKKNIFRKLFYTKVVLFDVKKFLISSKRDCKILLKNQQVITCLKYFRYGKTA